MRRCIRIGFVWALVSGCGEEIVDPGVSCTNESLSIQQAPNNSGDQQTATVATTLANPLRVLVQCGTTPASRVAVYWLAMRGSVSADSTITDASGIASVAWTLDPGAGQQQVAYALQRYLMIPAIDSVPHFTAVATPGPPSRLYFSVDPTNTFPGRPIRPPVRVSALDVYENVTALAGSITVALGTHAGAGVLSGTTRVDATCDSTGCGAAFTDLSIDQAGTGFTLVASADGLSGATSVGFEVVAPGPGRLAFSSNRDGNSEIYSMNADGSGVVRLTNDSAFDEMPAWSPDGATIALVSSRSGSRHIYSMNADGSGVAVMPDGLDFAPAWSRDGARIAGGSGYASRCPPRGQPCTRYDSLFVANADGTSLNVVTMGNTPAWSPEGRIAFARSAFANGDLYVMNADGSGLTNLTNGQAGNFWPAWSPDGTRLAFVSNRAGAYHLYVMNADGSGVTQLTHDHLNVGRPTWSPDGTRIAFASDKDGDSEIYVMHADGSGVVALTDNSVLDGWPAWAP